MNVTATCPECGHDVPATVDDAPVAPGTEAAAIRAYRRYPEKIAELNFDAAAIVRAALARDIDRTIAHMRVQDAIERRLRDHGAGYEDEPWFADVIDGAAAAALAAAGAERIGEER